MAEEINGVNVLLEGPTGTGKTAALATIALSGVDLFVLFTESGLESLVGRFVDPPPAGLGLKEVPSNVHWHILRPPEANFATMVQAAKDLNEMSLDILGKRGDPDRRKHNRFVHLLSACNDFVDERTGEKFGSVQSWGTDKCFAIDSLTGINPIAMSLLIGAAPVKEQRHWGIAQDQIEMFLRNVCDGCKCHFILLAHVERELDEVFNTGLKLTVSTLGRKLAPKIPPMFSDVVLSVREGTRFSWSTEHPAADLKARNLPIASNLQPDFKQIFERWRARSGK
jgi:hypothetical protein